MLPARYSAGFFVLIETSWNVKIRYITQKLVTLSINRNIVECKDTSCRISFCRTEVLIETSWNVKLVGIATLIRLPEY